MKAILQAIEEGRLDARATVVFSNNPQAPALAAALALGVPVESVGHRGLSREDHETRLLETLSRYPVDYVVLAGYMRVLTSSFLQHFHHQDGYFRIVNIHPSLLPAFPGANAYEEAFAYGVRLSGITIHLVDEKVDHGPILAQEAFARLEEDTFDDFKARGLSVEHRLYPQVLQSIALQGIRLLPSDQPSFYQETKSK